MPPGNVTYIMNVGWIFAHPWLLLGIVGVALPILIHLIGKKRAPQVSFAAFDFLIAVNQRLARRERLRQFLLLLLRCLALAALALALARPMAAKPAPENPRDRRLALVFDASGSMAYTVAGESLLERAKSRALALVSHLRAGDAVALAIVGKDVVLPLQTPSIDHAAVRAAIVGVAEPQGSADLGSAIDRVLRQLGDNGGGATLAIVGDLAATSFENVVPSSMDPPPTVRLLDAALRDPPRGPLPNASVVALVAERSPRSPTERIIRVTVRNHGDRALTRYPLLLSIDGEITQRAYLDIPARGSGEKRLTQTFSGAGLFRVRVTLQGSDEAYTIDDTAEALVSVDAGVRVLAINGDARTTPLADELYFLERALEAVPKGDPSLSLHIVVPEEASASAFSLAPFDVVILGNVGRATQELADKLAAFVEGGGGLFIALGDRIRFESFNALFSPLLPHALRDVHQAEDRAADTPAVGIGEIDWEHPIFAAMGPLVETSLRSSRTARYFNLDVGAGVHTRALMRFDSGAPALVEKKNGRGRVLLLTTSLDVDDTDLPLRSAFPALIQRAVRYLAHAVHAPHTGTVRQGDTYTLILPTGARGARVRSPSGILHTALVVPGEKRGALGPLNETGLHQTEVLRQNTWDAEPNLDVLVNPSLAESDFAPVSTDVLAKALWGQRQQSAEVAFMENNAGELNPFAATGAASYLLLALALIFIAESLLASRG